MHDEPRSELEQRALAAWTPAEPPADFVERVMRAAERPAPASPAFELPDVTPLRWPRFALAAVAAAAIAGGVAAASGWWPHARVSAPTAAPTSANDLEDAVGSPVGLTPAESHAPIDRHPDDLAEQIDRYMHSFGANHGEAFKFRGSVVVARAGEPLYTGIFGDGLGPDTRFKIGSLTQQFTAVAVLQLRDRGKLRLDDPVRAHLPTYPRADVTIRHLLTHTSGIPNYTDNLPAAGVKRMVAYEPQQIAAIFTGAALEFPPGSEFDPSNSGYFLLGMVVEELAGQPLGAYLKTHVFEPAGMTRSALGVHTIEGDREFVDGGELATGHGFSEDELLIPVTPFNLSVYGAAAGMVSTPTDLLRWDHALHQPGLLLAEASLDEMFTPVMDTYGLGWIVTRENGQTMVGHPGGVEGFNAAIARYLGDEITVIALANTEAIDCRNVLDAVALIAHGQQVPPFAEPIEVPVPPAMFERYLGDFVLTPASRSALARVVDDEDLAMMERVRVYDDNGRLFMLVPSHGAKWLHGLGDDRFFFKDHAGTTGQFGPANAPVEWLRLTQGDLEFVLSRAAAVDLPQTPTVEPGPPGP